MTAHDVPDLAHGDAPDAFDSPDGRTYSDPPFACSSVAVLDGEAFACGGTPGHAGKHRYLIEWDRQGAIAAQETHAAAELQAVESVYLYHWRFDRGEEYGLFRDKADAEAAAEARRAESPGEGLFEVLGMAILGRPEPQPAPELAGAQRYREALEHARTVLNSAGLASDRVSRARSVITAALEES